MFHSTRKPSMFDKVTTFFQQHKTILASIGFSLIILICSVFFYKYNSIAVGYSSKMIVLLGIIAALIVSVLGLFLSKPKLLSRVYFASLLVLGMLYSAVFFPLSVPDELYHYESSYYYSNLILGKSPSNDLIEIRETDASLINNAQPRLCKESYSNTKKALLADSSSTLTYMEYPIDSSRADISNNPPQVRLCSAIGLSVGQLLGLNGLSTFYLGRFFNYLAFALLAYLAFKITPIGKLLFISLSLLPMTLHICSSFSYDAIIIGLSFFFISLCLKAAFSDEKISRKSLIAITLSAILIAPCKLIYAFLSFAVLIIPNNKFKSKKDSTKWKLIVICATFASLFLFHISTLLSFFLPAASTVTSNSIEQEITASTPSQYTFSGLIAAPLNTVFIFANTVLTKTDFYLNSFLGGSLGWFQSELITPWFFILLFLGIILYSARKSETDKVIPSRKRKIIFMIISTIIALSAALSMLLGHTETSSLFVEGVQGRYFLPFAPLFFLLFRTKNTQRSKDSSPLILLTLFALNAMNLIYIWAAMARC